MSFLLYPELEHSCYTGPLPREWTSQVAVKIALLLEQHRSARVGSGSCPVDEASVNAAELGTVNHIIIGTPRCFHIIIVHLCNP